MPDIGCKICFYSLDKNKYLPRMLSCGHTFCTQCICNLLESTKSCPSCRRPLWYDSIDEFPVNYIVLEIKYSTKECKKSNELGSEKFKDNLLKLKTEFEFLLNSVVTWSDNIQGNIDQLDTLIAAEAPYDKASHDQLKTLKLNLETIRGQISHKDDTLTDVTFGSQDFKADFDIMAEIRRRMADNKQMAAVLKVNGVQKYASLSIKDNFLLVHAFQNWREEHEEFITILYQDLLDNLFKGKLPKRELFGFLDFSYQATSITRRLIIEVSSSSLTIGPQFLRLCMGESGVCYKGQSYCQKFGNGSIGTFTKDSIIQLEKFECDMKIFDNNHRYSRYMQGETATTKCHQDKLHLSYKDGSFEVVKFTQTTEQPVQTLNQQMHGWPNQRFSYVQHVDPYNVIAVEVDVSNIIGPIRDLKGDFLTTFSDATYGKIIDCGIAFKV